MKNQAANPGAILIRKKSSEVRSRNAEGGKKEVEKLRR